MTSGVMDKSPDAFRTISEVADDLDLPQHVLRFWESRFSQIKPMKRGGGRRYYRPDDVALLRGIRHLLYGQGYTIKGVQRILREQGIRFVQSVWEAGAQQPQADSADLEALEELEAEPEAPRRLLERLRAAEAAEPRRPPVVREERREPGFGPDVAPAGPRQAGLTAAERQALRAALTDLADCREMLEASLEEAR